MRSYGNCDEVVTLVLAALLPERNKFLQKYIPQKKVVLWAISCNLHYPSPVMLLNQQQNLLLATPHQHPFKPFPNSVSKKTVKQKK